MSIPLPLPDTQPTVEVVVYGQPVPQGSKRTVIHRSTGRPVTMESGHNRLVPWREAVKQAALAVRQHDGPGGHWTAPPLVGPLSVRMVFTVRRPKGHYRTGRNAALLRDAAPGWPASPPDLSKLARSTEDALTDAGLIADDALIVQYERLAKVYVGADSEALDVPGARIVIGGAA